MINVEIPIDNFLLKQNKTMKTRMQFMELEKKNVFHNSAIAISLIARFLEVRHDKWPDTHNVGNNFNQRYHMQLLCDDSPAEPGSRHHPRCSAPPRQLMMNSVIEKGFKQQKTDDTFFSGYLFSSRNSKIGYLTNHFLYPLLRFSTYVLARM